MQNNLKKSADKELQVNFSEVPNKWGIVCIDSKSYLQILVPNITDANIDYYIRSIQLCANAKYKGLFTSNNLYNVENMPKEMHFILPKNETFYDRYQWIFITHSVQQNENNQSQANVRPPRLEPPKQTESQKYIEPQKSKENLKSILKKKVQIVEPGQEEQNEIEQEELNNDSENNNSSFEDVSLKIPSSNQNGLKSSLKNKYKHKIVEQEQEQDLEDFEEQEKETVPIVYENCFQLQPTPIMRLSHIHGYCGGKKNVCSFGSGSILYSSGSVLIMQDVKTREQKYMFGQNSEIQQIVASSKDKLIITTDSTQISFWNSDTLQRTGFYYTGYQQILSVDITYYKKELYVALAGLDNAKRPGIMIIKGDQVKNFILK